MTYQHRSRLPFFPGCSLVTSASENYTSLQAICLQLGFELDEVRDWNCCGSSSAHCLDSGLAASLTERNLALMPTDGPCLVACPNCYKRLRQTFLRIQCSHEERSSFERRWGRPFPERLQLQPFLSFLAGQDLGFLYQGARTALQNLAYVPYYGCMLARPPIMNREPSHRGVMEKVLGQLGGRALPWRHSSKCCGTFLSVARPDLVTPMVQTIMDEAEQAGAECLVTACSMCHLNLEVRCPAGHGLPIFHFSELLALAAGVGNPGEWFNRHLIDPRPLLMAKGMLDRSGRVRH